MYCCGSTTLTGCVFEKNGSGEVGGGIRVWGRANARLTDCVFFQNRASDGGGIYVDSYDVMLAHCGFYGNKSLGKGGGASFSQGTQAELHNCTFAANWADTGGGICNGGSSSTVMNCILWGNIVSNPTGESAQINDYLGVVNYSCIQDWTGALGGVGNISADPCFADPGYWDTNGTPGYEDDDFFVLGDYHLKSEGGRWDTNEGRWVRDEVTSPCIDAGDPMSPIGQEPFANGGIVNMGAYGGTAEASKSYFGGPPCERVVAGDINGDCTVDFKDFCLMALHWFEDNAP